jgi:endoglucanase
MGALSQVTGSGAVMKQTSQLTSRVLVRTGLTAGAAILTAGCIAGPAPGTGSPLGIRFYVPSVSNARATADQWRRTRAADAAAMEFIARQPTAHWVGGWRGPVRRDVGAVVAGSTATGSIPVLVAYNIPNRDCGFHSGGGASDGQGYRQWIREFAAGVGGRRAIVILEPDALAGIECLPQSAREERVTLIRDAVDVLKGAGATVYVDAGHARWHSPEVMAARLRQAGITRADGFALNVSNYVANAPNIVYGERLSALVGGKRFVIDTSRNGAGTAPPGAWCNVPGQALGVPPTTETGHRLVDAFLWVKVPGESDGRCGGGPEAGQWWPEYALDLVRRARVKSAG